MRKITEVLTILVMILINGCVIKDVDKPKITLNGTTMSSIFIGENYMDPGVSAYDNLDGDITTDVKKTIWAGTTMVTAIDTTTIGAYTIKYNVVDKAGNKADEVSRYINVQERILYFGDEEIKLLTVYNDGIVSNFKNKYTIFQSSGLNNLQENKIYDWIATIKKILPLNDELIMTFIHDTSSDYIYSMDKNNSLSEIYKGQGTEGTVKIQMKHKDGIITVFNESTNIYYSTDKLNLKKEMIYGSYATINSIFEYKDGLLLSFLHTPTEDWIYYLNSRGEMSEIYRSTYVTGNMVEINNGIATFFKNDTKVYFSDDIKDISKKIAFNTSGKIEKLIKYKNGLLIGFDEGNEMKRIVTLDSNLEKVKEYSFENKIIDILPYRNGVVFYYKVNNKTKVVYQEL